MSVKFSVLIPAYKSKFLKKCIESILSQSFCDFEIVILNDASPENVKEIVCEYDDPRIKYFENSTNIGAIDVVDNWNKCLTYASGDFVICMGDDDELFVDCLETYNNLIIKYPLIDIFHANTILINEEDNLIDIQEARPEYESVYSLMWHRWVKNRIQFIGDFLYRKDSLQRKGGFYKLPFAWASDDITAYVVAKENGIVNGSKPMFKYRVNRYSITNTGNIEIKMNAILLEKKWALQFLQELYPLDELDVIYKKLLIDNCDNFFLKKYLITIAEDLSASHFHFLKWWLKSSKYYIPKKYLFYSFFESLKIRNRRNIEI